MVTVEVHIVYNQLVRVTIMKTQDVDKRFQFYRHNHVYMFAD